MREPADRRSPIAAAPAAGPRAHRRAAAGSGSGRTTKADAARPQRRRDDPAPRGDGGGSGGRPPAGGGGSGRPPRPPRGLGLAQPRKRVRAMFLAVLVTFSVFAAQLVRLQIIDAPKVSEAAHKARSSETPTLAPRGRITDRNGIALASSVERRLVVVDPHAVPEYTKKDPGTKKTVKVGVDQAAIDLAPLIGKSVEQTRADLTGEGRYKRIAFDLEPEQWRRIDALHIPGITSEKSYARSYPGGASTAPLIGWVGADGEAKDGNGSGLELLQNPALKSTPGRSIREISADNRIIPMGQSEITPAVPGKDVRLTIDRDLNWYAYNAIAAQVRKSKAEWGAVVVMDLQGRLRAVAQAPGFDPGKRDKNAALGSVPFVKGFEPGSTAKVITIGAALEEKAVTPLSEFSIENRLKRADRSFQDSHDHPTERLTTAGILAQSSNIGTIKVGEKIAPATLEKYYRAFGLGRRSGVGFPGETPGLLKPSSQWDASQRYTVMFGQGVSMSAIQGAGVFQTIANGGVRMPATLVDSTVGPDGVATPAPLPAGERVLSPKTAEDLSVMLESVTKEGGTAVQAAIPGVPVSGKTGTADRYDEKLGRYDGKTASFIGYAPADKPQFVVAVILQKPTAGGYFGGSTAGPVFQQVMSYALQRFGVPPTGNHRTLFPLKAGEAPTSSRPTQAPSVSAPDLATDAPTADPSASPGAPQPQASTEPGQRSTASGDGPGSNPTASSR